MHTSSYKKVARVFVRVVCFYKEYLDFRLAHSRAAANFFAEPCGLENTHDAVMHVHQLVVSTPNESAHSRETHFRSSKDMPQRWLISPIWAEITSKLREKERSSQ